MAGFASFLFGGGQTSRSLKLVVIYLALLPLCALAFVHWRHAKPIAGDGGASRPVGTLSEAVENGSPGRAGVRRRLVLMTGDGPWPGALAGRPYIPFAAIPEELKRALLYQEDRAFYTHAGYSPREMYIALRDWLLYGHRLRGASTLTQQLARTIFLSSRRKLSRKLLEFRLALLLEERLPKDRILELYINQVYGAENPAARRKPPGRSIEALPRILLRGWARGTSPFWWPSCRIQMCALRRSGRALHTAAIAVCSGV